MSGADVTLPEQRHNGVEWSADTLEALAVLVEGTGRRIAPPPVDDR
jgi:hypothetical protein